jgi:hypothetical protein
MSKGKYARFAVVFRESEYRYLGGGQQTLSKHITRAAAERARKKARTIYQSGFIQIHKIAGR